jgi:hypothetical protein
VLFFTLGIAVKRCVTQRALLILTEDFYVTNNYCTLGEARCRNQIGLARPVACTRVEGRAFCVILRTKMSTMDTLPLFPLLILLLPGNLAFMLVSTRGRKNLVRHLNTGFELFQKALPEKLAEKLVEKWVSASPQFQPQSSYPQPSIHNHISSFFADTENLFAIEARICNLSLAIEPVKILHRI